ncbi:N-acetylmuramoyl-L-alanine amidase family protein [Sulfurospirillum arcachonense]|uniref:N-acetylmuramoyl-L-alanine amidase family protein n=1 Tax=Sulfurospirillum arcachonense TaxID=57666 RepID=UPI0004AD1A79|nr:N-acetylmuramoyl-L-alanine amidase [Sulfurospirillum arcachonense]
MAKIVKLLFLLFISYSAVFSASNYINELISYDKKIKTADDDELLRVHHAIKSIYIQSIIKNDNTLKEQTLQRLVKTSNILKFDSSGYAKELATLQKISGKKKTFKSKRKVVPKKTIAPPKKINKHKTHLARLKGISNKGDMLELSFDQKLTSKDIKSFQLKAKNTYREVFDIKAILSFVPSMKTPKALKSLRIAQYNNKTLRIVFQRNSILKSTIKVHGRKIDILYNSKNSPKTKVTTEKKDYTKYIKPLSSRKIIVIDAGHGGKDAGAVGSKTQYEKRVVLQIALKTGRILQKRGYRVYYTRTNDKFIRLRNRTRYANKKGADIFLSIHANASRKKSLHGIETFFLSPARSKRSKNVAALENKSDMQEMDYFSKQTFLNVFNREKIIAANKLALDVQQGMLNRIKKKYSGVRDGGVREAPFWVLVGAQMPSILVETGYISNKYERKRIFNSHYQTLMANGIADGIDSYFVKNEY